MPTFQELQSTLTALKFKRAVIQHLVEYIDSNFRPIAGGDSKNKLMTDDKVPVPPEIFESIVADILLKEDGDFETQMVEILGANIQEAAESKKPKKSK